MDEARLTCCCNKQVTGSATALMLAWQHGRFKFQAKSQAITLFMLLAAPDLHISMPKCSAESSQKCQLGVRLRSGNLHLILGRAALHAEQSALSLQDRHSQIVCQLSRHAALHHAGHRPPHKRADTAPCNFNRITLHEWLQLPDHKKVSDIRNDRISTRLLLMTRPDRTGRPSCSWPVMHQTRPVLRSSAARQYNQLVISG